MLSCAEHDYIEIVCMYSFPVRLTLKSLEVVEGTALDTQLNEQCQECIKLDAGGDTVLVLLNSISSMEVCVENPHFNSVSFDQSN